MALRGSRLTVRIVVRLLLVFLLASCGGLIPLLIDNDDDDEPPPPPPRVVDSGPGDVDIPDVVDDAFVGDGSCEIAGLTCTETTRCCGSASDCRLGTCCIRSGPTSNVTLCCTKTKAPTCEAGALCCLDDQ